jgi:hypothetical protein
MQRCHQKEPVDIGKGRAHKGVFPWMHGFDISIGISFLIRFLIQAKGYIVTCQRGDTIVPKGTFGIALNFPAF